MARMTPEEAEYYAELQTAMRKRLLAQVAGGEGGGSVINNNVYGGGVGRGGVGDGLPEAIDPSDRDYFVDIVREDLPEINPDTGKPRGWKKSVHRFATEKKK